VCTVSAAQSSEAVVAEVCAWLRRDLSAAAIGAQSARSVAEFDSANHAPSLSSEPIYSGELARLFDRLTDGLMAALMAFMVAAVFGNVVLRYAFGTGWAGAEELSRLAFVWLGFVVVSSSMRLGEFMLFNMIRDRFPQVARRLVDSASWLLVAGASVLAALGAWQQVQYGWGNHSTVVGYPVVLGMFPVLACMAVLALLALLQLVNVWRRPEPLPVANANITAD
jgi:gluconokinase